jgi:hypothetical protein
MLDGTIQLTLDRHRRWLTVQDGPVRVAPEVPHEVRDPLRPLTQMNPRTGRHS